VAEAKKLPLGRPDTAGLLPAQARAVTAAADEASLDAFHLGLGIAALLVAAGGLAGAIGVRNPRRAVLAQECEGGQLVGAALDAAGCHEGDLALSGAGQTSQSA
jgi:hypothetical protein